MSVHQPTSGSDLEHQLKLPESLFDHLPVGIAIFDQQFVLRRYNPAWRNLVSRYFTFAPNKNLAGMKLDDLLPGASKILRPLLKQALVGETVYQEAVHLKNNDATFYWDLALAPIEIKQQPGAVIVTNDVTQPVSIYQQLQNRVETHARDLDALLEVSRNLVSLDQDKLLNQALKQLKAIMNYSGAAIWLLENDHFTPLIYQGSFSQEQIFKLPAPLIGPEASRRLIATQKPVILANTQADTPPARRFRRWIDDQLTDWPEQIQSWMGIPLVFKSRVIGLFTLHHHRPNFYSDQQSKVALAFADYVAVAMENDRLYQQASNIAALEERNLLARELHDNVAQALGYMNLQAAATSQLLSEGQTEAAQTKLNELKEIVDDTYTDVREEIFNLRTIASANTNFLETLRDYVSKYKQHYNLEIELAIETDEANLQFPTNVGTQLIRIIQEALINVRKHSGVKKALIRFQQEAGQLCVSVEDSGQGFDLETVDKTGDSGFGLQIMRERARSINGWLELNTAPGGGVRVAIWMSV